jgi:Bacterial SH3 domain
MKRAWLFIGLIIFVGTGFILSDKARAADNIYVVPTSKQAQDDCTGLIAPQLSMDMTARVTPDDGVGLVLRDAPQTDSHVVDNLPEDSIFQVIGESHSCADKFLWWQVRLIDGREGYLAEGSSRYFAEPYPLALHLFEIDSANPNQINHQVIDSAGRQQSQPPFNLALFRGTGSELWQPPELQATNLVFADRLANCPQQLPTILANTTGIQDIVYSELDGTRQLFPAPNNQQLLVIRHYTLDLPTCDGSQHELYGSSYISLLSAAGEQIIFPFSQHSDPPPSQFCQIPIVTHAEQKTLLHEIAWSPDSQYVALGVRYLRNGISYPCAFYHIFIINTATLESHYAGEGRRLASVDDRLYALRNERSDPNQAGIQYLFSVLPDGTNTQIIPIPENLTWLPDAMDLQNTYLPWSEGGAALLACVGDGYQCTELVNYHIDSSRADIIPLPDGLQLGSTLQAVYYVAEGSQLLWLSTEGDIYLQSFDGKWSAIESPLLQESRIIRINILPKGIGALLEREDGQRLYLNVLDKTVQTIND